MFTTMHLTISFHFRTLEFTANMFYVESFVLLLWPHNMSMILGLQEL